ncbi:MAG: ABC transporter permease, partial [Terriglobales bacterium]
MGELLRRLRMLVGSRRWRRELEEEMQLHRELRGDEKRFGNELRLRERSRAQWGWTWLETWGQDIRHGLRLLGRTPLITALALVSLGLGIGATTALFSLTDAVLLRPLPIAHPNQLVQLTNNVFTSGSNFWAEFSDPLWRRIEQAGAFAGTLAVSQRGDPMLVSGSYFQVLGIHAQAGRLFSQTDLGHGCPAAVDISNSYWHQRFNASPSTIGSTVRFRNTVFRIIGVTPPSFFGTEVGRSFHAIAPLC